jgi:hypothetical protein
VVLHISGLLFSFNDNGVYILALSMRFFIKTKKINMAEALKGFD